MSSKRNFKLKMHLACGKDDLRPIMQHVFFTNGYMIATDAHVLIKAKTSVFTDFSEDEIQHLEGKFVHRDTFAKLLKVKMIEVDESGFKDLATKDLYNFSVPQGKYPNVESVMPGINTKEIDCIGLLPNNINPLFKIMSTSDFSTLRLSFFEKNKAIKVTSELHNPSDIIGVIMPSMLN